MPVLLLILLSLCGLSAQTRAEAVPLADEELSRVWGQSLLEFRNTSYSGYNFSRITMNAVIDVSANLGGVSAGVYGSGGLDVLDGAGVGINIGTLQLGRSDGSEAQRLVSLSNPYIELAYAGGSGEENAALVGMRLGFEGVQGEIGIAMTELSGALLIDLGDAVVLDTLVSAPVTEMPGLNQIGTLHAGNTSGPSRDFFISLLSAPLVYPEINGIVSPAALPGIWINWRDRLSGTLGATPPNSAK